MGRGHPQGRWKFSPKNRRSPLVKAGSKSPGRRLFDEHCWDDETGRTCENPTAIVTRWWRAVVHSAGGMDECDMRLARALDRVELALALRWPLVTEEQNGTERTGSQLRRLVLVWTLYVAAPFERRGSVRRCKRRPLLGQPQAQAQAQRSTKYGYGATRSVWSAPTDDPCSRRRRFIKVVPLEMR